MWYKSPDNTMKQVPYNSFCNLLNMETFIDIFPRSKSGISASASTLNKSQGTVVYTNQDMRDANYKNIFDDWHYETTDINYIV
jgi:hypothetical protein